MTTYFLLFEVHFPSHPVLHLGDDTHMCDSSLISDPIISVDPGVFKKFCWFLTCTRIWRPFQLRSLRGCQRSLPPHGLLGVWTSSTPDLYALVLFNASQASLHAIDLLSVGQRQFAEDAAHGKISLKQLCWGELTPHAHQASGWPASGVFLESAKSSLEHAGQSQDPSSQMRGSVLESMGRRPHSSPASWVTWSTLLTPWAPQFPRLGRRRVSSHCQDCMR